MGNVDAVQYRVVSGWAYDTRQSTQPIFVRCKVNGTEIGITVADRYRADIAAAGHPTGLSGFEFAVPDCIEEIESVQVRFVETGIELPGSSNSLARDKSNQPLPAAWKRGDRLRFPSAFLLGGSKCGTSSLYTYLEQHPRICMSKPKEPMYFEAEFGRGKAYYFNRYFSHWNGEEIVMDARVGHLYLPYIPQRLFDYNPEARLVVVLRNPTERAISSWWHWYSRGLESLPLSDAIAVDMERINSGYRLATKEEQALFERASREIRKGMFRTYVDAGYFHEQLCRYLEFFPRTQLHVVLFDDLASDPKTVVSKALEFLGVESDLADRFLYPIVNRSDPEVINHLDAATISLLVEHYRPHNKKLEEFLGRSLEHWNSTGDGAATIRERFLARNVTNLG